MLQVTYMEPSPYRRMIVLAMVALMVVSAGAGGALAIGDDGALESHEEMNGEQADEIFIDNEGNAALLFEDDTSETATGEFGVDVVEGVVYAMVTDEVEEDVSGAFELWLEQGSFDMEGQAAVDRPEALQAFQLDISAVQTAEESSTEASLELAADASEEPSAEMIDTASTQGQFEAGSDHLATSGEAGVEFAFENPAPSEALAVSVQGTAGDYTLEVDRTRPLNEPELQQWETEDAARQTLQNQFEGIAEAVGGQATVTIHEHALTTDEQERSILDISYTVEYTGIDGIGDIVATELAADPSLDLTEAEAQAFADAVMNVELNTVEVSYATEPSSANADWAIDVSNLQPLAEETSTLISAGAQGDASYAEDFQTYLEAQQAADLVQTSEWAIDLERSGSVISLEADLQSEATNWDAYVEELEAEGMNVPEFEADAFAELVDDEISLEMALQVTSEQMLDEAISSIGDELEQDPTVTEQERAMFEAFQSAELEITGVTLDTTDGTMTLTAGASFADLAAFQDVIEEEYHGLSPTHFYGDVSSGEGYVYAPGAFESGVDEETVRAHPAVGEDTTITFVDSFDELPRLDLAPAGEFLGVDVGEASVPSGGSSDDGDDSATDDGSDDGTTDGGSDDTGDSDDGGDDSLPGFGLVAATMALVASLGLLRRRR